MITKEHLENFTKGVFEPYFTVDPTFAKVLADLILEVESGRPVDPEVNWLLNRMTNFAHDKVIGELIGMFGTTTKRERVGYVPAIEGLTDSEVDGLVENELYRNANLVGRDRELKTSAKMIRSLSQKLIEARNKIKDKVSFAREVMKLRRWNDNQKDVIETLRARESNQGATINALRETESNLSRTIETLKQEVMHLKNDKMNLDFAVRDRGQQIQRLESEKGMFQELNKKAYIKVDELEKKGYEKGDRIRQLCEENNKLRKDNLNKGLTICNLEKRVKDLEKRNEDLLKNMEAEKIMRFAYLYGGGPMVQGTKVKLDGQELDGVKSIDIKTEGAKEPEVQGTTEVIGVNVPERDAERVILVVDHKGKVDRLVCERMSELHKSFLGTKGVKFVAYNGPWYSTRMIEVEKPKPGYRTVLCVSRDGSYCTVQCKCYDRVVRLFYKRLKETVDHGTKEPMDCWAKKPEDHGAKESLDHGTQGTKESSGTKYVNLKVGRPAPKDEQFILID